MFLRRIYKESVKLTGTRNKVSLFLKFTTYTVVSISYYINFEEMKEVSDDPETVIL